MDPKPCNCNCDRDTRAPLGVALAHVLWAGAAGLGIGALIALLSGRAAGAEPPVSFAAFEAPTDFGAFSPPGAVEPPPVTLVREYHPQLGGWVLVQRPAPGVPASQPFRDGYHAGHSCPACGTAQYRVSGFNADGTHNHQCPRCGAVWRH